jgi:hypothetical protein
LRGATFDFVADFTLDLAVAALGLVPTFVFDLVAPTFGFAR